MSIICLLFILIPALVGVVVIGWVALRSLYADMTLGDKLAKTRKWITAAITTSATLAAGHYAFNGLSNVTIFLATVLASLVVAWFILWLVEGLMQTRSPKSRAADRDRDHYRLN